MPELPRHRRRMVGGLAAIYIAVGALTAVVIVDARHSAQERAATVSRNLTLLAEAYFVGLFDQVDLGLLSIAREASAQGAGRVSAERLDAFLGRHVTGLPETSRFGLADASGRVVYTTGPFADRATLKEYVSTQDFFVAAQEGEDGLHIAHRAEPTDPDGLYLSRRADDRSREFAGVAFARLPLGEIRAFLSQLDIGPSGGISLRDPEMRIVVRHPDPRGLFRGNANLSPELKALLGGGATRGTYFSGTTWDGTARTVTFTRVGRYPLYVAVGLASTDYLADWRRGALTAAAAYTAALAFGGAVLLTLRRRAARGA